MTLKLYFMKCYERKISLCILPFRTPTLLKRDSDTDFLQQNLKNFSEHLVSRLSPAAGSAGLRFPACISVKKEAPAKMFFGEFYKIFKNIIWQNTSGWLFLVFIENFEKFFRKPLIEHLFSCTSCRISSTRYSMKLFHKCFSSILQERQERHSKTLKS